MTAPLDSPTTLGDALPRTLPDLPKQDGIKFQHISGFPGYAVGDNGTIWTCLKLHGLGIGNGSRSLITDTWRQKAVNGSSGGYLRVSFMRGGQSSTRLVHRLVLEAFVGPCPKGMEACHFPDRDRRNCSISNLRWDTRKNNHADKIAHGTDQRGERGNGAKLRAVDVIEMRAIRAKTGATYKTIGQRYGVRENTAHRAITGRNWKSIHG